MNFSHCHGMKQERFACCQLGLFTRKLFEGYLNLLFVCVRKVLGISAIRVSCVQACREESPNRGMWIRSASSFRVARFPAPARRACNDPQAASSLTAIRALSIASQRVCPKPAPPRHLLNE